MSRRPYSSPGSSFARPTSYPGDRVRGGLMTNQPNALELAQMRDELERQSREDRLDEMMRTMDPKSIMGAAAKAALPIVTVQALMEVGPKMRQRKREFDASLPVKVRAKALQEMGVDEDVAKRLAPRLITGMNRLEGIDVTPTEAVDILSYLEAAKDSPGAIEAVKNDTLEELRSKARAAERVLERGGQPGLRSQERVNAAIKALRGAESQVKKDPPKMKFWRALGDSMKEIYNPKKLALPVLAGVAGAAFMMVKKRRKYQRLLEQVRQQNERVGEGQSMYKQSSADAEDKKLTKTRRVLKALPFVGAVAGGAIGAATKGRGGWKGRAARGVLGAGTGATTGWLPSTVSDFIEVVKEKRSFNEQAYFDELMKVANPAAGGGMGDMGSAGGSVADDGGGDEGAADASQADTEAPQQETGPPPTPPAAVPPQPMPAAPPPPNPHLPQDATDYHQSPVIRSLGSRVQQFDPRRAQGFPLLAAPQGYVFAPHLQAFLPGPGWVPGDYAQQAAINAQIYQKGMMDATTRAAATRMAEQQQEQVIKDQQQKATQSMMMAAQQRSLMRSAAKPGGAV